MTAPTNTDPTETHANLVQWRQRLEQEYSLRELKALCWRLNIDPESLHHETKPELALDLVQYLHRRGRIPDLETEHHKYRASRRDTLAAYRRRVLEETQFVELKGIPLPRGRDGRIYDPHVPLDKVYIQLQAIAEEEKRRDETAEREALEAKARAEADRKATGGPLDFLAGLRTLGEYFYRQGQVYRTTERPQPVNPQEALVKHERLVILGPPGSGKSTLLRFLARRAAEDEQGRVPILVSLRDFANTYAQNRALNLFDFALDAAASGNDDLRLALEATVEKGRILWLLDALDETRLLADEVALQAHRLPGSFIVTSRPVGYSGGLLRSLPHFEVLPLAPEKVDQFLTDWMGVFVGEQSEPKEIEQRVIRLQAQLKERPQLQALTRNPLLLTFMVTLASQSGAADLPQQRAQLYARYIEELRDWEIQRQAQASGDPGFVFRLGNLQGEKARQVVRDGLTYLGWALHLNYYGGRGTELPDPEALIRQVTQYLTQDGYDDAGSLAKAVLDFWQTAGMFDVWQLEGHSYLAFRHLTFQEYAAAWGLQHAWVRNKSDTWHFLEPRLHHPAWRESILLWTGLMDERHLADLVRRLRRGVTPYENYLHRDLRLAAAMLGESSTASESLAQDIIERLAWLGREHERQQILLLGAMYSSGIVLLFIFLPFFLAITAGIVWSGLWLGCFFKPLFPQIQAILGLLLRWRGLATTPFTSAYSSITTIGHATLLVPHLLAALQDGWGVSQIARKVLNQFGEVAVPFFIKALQNEDWGVRQTVGNELSRFGKVAVNPLLAALRNEDAGVRRIAAFTLGNIKDADAVPDLMMALQDENKYVQWAVIWALGQIGEAVVVPHLITLLQDEDSDVQQAAAEALGQIRNTAAVPALTSTIQDENRDVRLAAVTALGQIGDATAVPYLIDVLNNKDWGMCRTTATALGRIGDAMAVPHLIDALQDEDKDVRMTIVAALGDIGDTDAVPYLITALQDKR